MSLRISKLPSTLVLEMLSKTQSLPKGKLCS